MIPGNKGTCRFFQRECVDKECEKCDKYDTSDEFAPVFDINTNTNMNSPYIDEVPKNAKELEKSANAYENGEEYKKKRRKGFIVSCILYFFFLVVLPIVFVHMFMLLETL